MKPDFEKNLFDKRMSYDKFELDFEHIPANPFDIFSQWYSDAESLLSENSEANAVVLSTSDIHGRVSSRLVLIKYFSEDGFVFFTNYLSKKGVQLSENENAALLFYWSSEQRQVRIEGSVEKVDPRFSDLYFSQRPLESRASAVVSPQSREIKSKSDLISKIEELSQSNDIQRPDYWGGYIVKPYLMEFWQGRPGRFHDRIEYVLNSQNGKWNHRILAP
jgi:pyridoxamine 5'-phosphate oxidase